MPNVVHIVKNSKYGGNRPLAEYQDDLEAALENFESETGIKLPPMVRRSLGAKGHVLNSKRDRAYTHPFPFFTSEGEFVFGCLAVPADIDDGLADFTNLYVLATQDRLLVVFNDPHWVYNPFFGGAVLELIERDSLGGERVVSQLVFEILGFTVAALDHALEALSNRRDHYTRKVKQIDKERGAEIETEVERRLPSLENLQIEAMSLQTVVEELARMLASIAAGEIQVAVGDESLDYFEGVDRASRTALRLHSAHLVAFLRSLLFDIDALIERLDRYQERALTMATHRVTALGALILIPNLVFDYFGQAFGTLPKWWIDKGFHVTLIGTVAYWLIQYAWYKKKKYI